MKCTSFFTETLNPVLNGKPDQPIHRKTKTKLDSKEQFVRTSDIFTSLMNMSRRASVDVRENDFNLGLFLKQRFNMTLLDAQVILTTFMAVFEVSNTQTTFF